MQIYAESSDLSNVFITNLLNCFRKNKAKAIEEKAQIGYRRPSFNISSNNRFGLKHKLKRDGVD